MELHYGLLLQYGKQIADKFYDEFVKYAVEVNDDVIKKANSFRAEHRKRKVSYVDCVGYTLALSRNISFLTGDKEFKEMEHVTFVQ